MCLQSVQETDKEVNKAQQHPKKSPLQLVSECFCERQQQGQPVDSKIDPPDLSFIQFTTSGNELNTRPKGEGEADLQGRKKRGDEDGWRRRLRKSVDRVGICVSV